MTATATRRFGLDKDSKPEGLITVAELQSWLGCGRTKAYELLANEIPSYRVGRLVRVRVADVEEFLERHRHGA